MTGNLRRQFIKLSVQTAGALFALASLPGSIRRAMATQHVSATNDEFVWLEEREGKAAQQWVKQQNQRTIARFADSEDFR